MAATTILSTFLILLISTQIQAQNSSAPAPTSAPTTNITGLLDKAGQFTTFIRLLTATQVINQIQNQLNSSSEGLTIFAPTDNAFNNLKAGALNGLTAQQQVNLLQYHILPKYYTLTALQTVSNPVPTQASDESGVYGLNFTGSGSQVNVSTGIVSTQISNPLRQSFPLAVYEVDKVLLPEQLFGTKAPAKSPPPPATTSGVSNTTNTTTASSPTSSPPAGSDAGSVRGFSMGLVVGLWLICMGVVF